MMSAFLTGGYPDAPSLELMIVVPIIIFLISDRISGTIWAIIISITYIVFVVLSQQGYAFSKIFILPGKHNFYLKLYIWQLMFVIIIGTLFIYDYITRHAKHNQDTYCFYKAQAFEEISYNSIKEGRA